MTRLPVATGGNAPGARPSPDPKRMEAALRLIAAGRGPDRYDGMGWNRQPRVTRSAMRDLARQALAAPCPTCGRDADSEAGT